VPVPIHSSDRRLQGRVVVITGANCGIGKETAAALAARGATIVLACRDMAKAEQAAAEIRATTGNDAVETVLVDLNDLHSVVQCADDVLRRFKSVHVLVNNAGGYWDVRTTTLQGFEQHFGVNYLSHYVLTRRLLDAPGAGAPDRIVNVTSVGHRAVSAMNWDDLQLEHGWSAARAYGQSKLAQILFTRELARRFGGRGIIAHAAHPGVVRTRFAADGDTHGIQRLVVRAGSVFGISPAAGARTPVHLASSGEAAAVNGRYWRRSRPHHPSRAAMDADAATRLWDVSEGLAAAAGVALS
jgi:NAD(P)-dependent dehydrogenase (short-subunit alcohol dehydrogenase family)